MKKGLLILAIMFVASCGTSNETRFYNISPLEMEEKSKTTFNKSIGVEEIIIAGYAKRPQIVTYKTGTSEVNLADFNRWIEPLSNSVQRTVFENMNEYFNKPIARGINASGRKYFDYVVYIEITRIDGELGENANLEAWWTIFDSSRAILANEMFKSSVKIGDSYDSLVQGHNKMVRDLSVEISKKISKMK